MEELRSFGLVLPIFLKAFVCDTSKAESELTVNDNRSAPSTICNSTSSRNAQNCTFGSSESDEQDDSCFCVS